jgi:hypothetical protein
MRRTALLASLLLLLVPAASQAQIRILAGAGVTNPMGDLSDVAGVGWNAAAGLQLVVASLPVGLRADGAYHSFGEEGGNPGTSILAGALSVTVTLPGVGLQPYVLGGVGMYRTSFDADGVDAASDSGIHGAFGVDIGQFGFGGFAEVRFVNVSTEGSGSSRYVSATLGLRL